MLKDSSTTERHYRWIIEIVSKLARHESTAGAVVEASILNSMEALLRSPPTGLHLHIYVMLENLAFHESTAMAVVRMVPLDLLGTLCETVEDTGPISSLARWWERLVTTKLLDAQCRATAEATC
ncbi:hypothetical protein C8J57DRAFT_1729832, partial [Mycena rebaudengoi]